MKAVKILVATLIGLGSVCLSERPASAEWFADAFVGPTFTRSHDVKIDDRAAGRTTVPDVEFDTGLAWGGRFGRYFEAMPFLGVAVNLLNFSADTDSQPGLGSLDISATAVSLDLMLRLPLFKTPEAPQGRIQPYIAVGVPLFVTTVTPRETTRFRNHHSGTDVSVGYMGAAGVAVPVYTNLALFAEYRFNHAGVDVDLQNSASASPTSLRTDLNSHSTLIGISARW